MHKKNSTHLRCSDCPLLLTASKLAQSLVSDQQHLPKAALPQRAGLGKWSEESLWVILPTASAPPQD